MEEASREEEERKAGRNIGGLGGVLGRAGSSLIELR